MTLCLRGKDFRTFARGLFNTERANIEGRYLDEIVDPKSAETISNNFRQCIETKAPIQYDEFAILPNRSYSTSLIPIMGNDGIVTRLIGISRDITELKQTEAHLRENEAFIRNINNNLVSGMIYQVLRLKDVTRKFTYLSDSVQRLYGVNPEQGFEDPMLIYGRIYEKDQPRVAEEEEKAFRTLSVFKIRTRITNPDGSIRWSSFVSNPRRIDDGTTIWDGIELDITELIKAEESLNQSREMYQLLAENISDVIWILDANEMRFHYVSPSVEGLRGYTVEEVLRQSISEVLTPNSLQLFQEKFPAYVQEFLDGNAEFHTNEVEQPCKDGSTVWTEATTTFRINESNSHLEVYGVSRNITERKLNEQLLMQANQKLRSHVKQIEQLSSELQEQAIRDPLTNLFNRRYFTETFERELKRAERENTPISLLLMDIDHFKSINDSYGHKVGDKFLEAIADLLSSMARKSDIPCRFGGEEFLLVLLGANAADAYERAEQFRQNSAGIKIPHQDSTLSVTISIGISTFPVGSKDAEELVIQADKAMYQSKQNGRNRVTIWHGS